MAPRLCLRRRLAKPAGLLAGVVLIVAETVCSSHAAAQTRKRPHADEPSVIIDYGVLDQLGRAPNVPEALRPTIRRPGGAGPSTDGRLTFPEGSGGGAGRIVLRPPGSRSAPHRLARRPAAVPPRPVVLRPPRPKPAMAEAAAGTRPGAATISRPAAPTPPARPKLAARTPAPRAPKAPVVAEPLPRDDGQFTEPIDPRIAASVAAPEAAKPAPASPPTRTAARTPAAAATPGRADRSRKPAFGVGRRYSLAFDPGIAKLDADDADTLDEVAEGLKGNGRLRLQLLAYAGGPGQSSSQSRRLSLSRALSVRSYLIDKGVGSTRIDVRALGNRFHEGPPDRVDVVVTER